jgi:hypothetical protein
MKYLLSLILTISAGVSICVGAEKEAHDEGHHEEAEESSAVGPDKGIIAKSEEGMKISPEAFLNFGVKTIPFSEFKNSIPMTALIEIKDGKYLYRMRDGWIKRVPIKILQKNKDMIVVEASPLQTKDEVITQGVGFLRAAELVAEQGDSQGHSH